MRRFWCAIHSIENFFLNERKAARALRPCADSCCARHCIRRYRHQPAVCLKRGVPSGPRHRAEYIFCFWRAVTVVMVVAVKYVWFIMRADNHGEGGPLALMALGLSRIPRQSKAAARMLMLGLF